MKTRPRKRHVQLTLDRARKLVGRGGWRPGSGRPRGRKTVPHDARPMLAARYPVHVTLRVRDGVPSIASEWLMKVIRTAVRDSQKDEFRIVEFNVLANHVHAIVEAASSVALSRGVQGFAGRVAKRINSALHRSGKLFATRFHARALKTPREVRNTLRYVLLNRKHHAAERHFDKDWIDPCSSAAWFDGWSGPIRGNAAWKQELVEMEPPTARAKTWLLTMGWRRHGPLAFDEAPA